MLASATITMFIFGFWSIATFGVNGGVLAALKGGSAESPESSSQVAAASAAVEGESGPLSSLANGLSTGFGALMESIRELKNGLSPDNLQSEYSEMKDRAIETYGQ